MTAPADALQIAEQLPSVLAARDRAAFERLLAPDVRWGGQEGHRADLPRPRAAGDFYAALLAGAPASTLWPAPSTTTARC